MSTYSLDRLNSTIKNGKREINRLLNLKNKEMIKKKKN